MPSPSAYAEIGIEAAHRAPSQETGLSGRAAAGVGSAHLFADAQIHSGLFGAPILLADAGFVERFDEDGEGVDIRFGFSGGANFRDQIPLMGGAAGFEFLIPAGDRSDVRVRSLFRYLAVPGREAAPDVDRGGHFVFSGAIALDRRPLSVSFTFDVGTGLGLTVPSLAWTVIGVNLGLRTAPKPP